MAEGFLRLAPAAAPQLDLDIYRSEGELLLLQPNLERRHVSRHWDVEIRTNHQGWRDGPGGVRAQAVGLGDSFAFGWGVEADESFYSRIEQELGLPLLNAGVPGTATIDHERLLARLLNRDGVRFALLAFYVGNDFTETGFGGADRLRVVDGLLELKPVDGSSAGGSWRGLARRSRLLQLLRAVQFRIGRQVGADAPPRNWDGWMREFAQVHLAEPSGRATQAIAATLASLDRIADICSDRDTALAVIVLPRSFQIVAEEKGELTDELGISPDALDLDRPQRTLTEWAAGRDALLIDPLEEFRRREREGEQLFYSPDAHFTPAGHEAVATVATPLLREWAAKLGER